MKQDIIASLVLFSAFVSFVVPLSAIAGGHEGDGDAVLEINTAPIADILIQPEFPVRVYVKQSKLQGFGPFVTCGTSKSVSKTPSKSDQSLKLLTTTRGEAVGELIISETGVKMAFKQGQNSKVISYTMLDSKGRSLSSDNLLIGAPNKLIDKKKSISCRAWTLETLTKETIEFLGKMDDPSNKTIVLPIGRHNQDSKLVPIEPAGRVETAQ